MTWFHVEYMFFKPDATHRRQYYLRGKQLKEFKEYLDQVVKVLHPYINRKFFLFEPKPHCFLALELKGSRLSSRIIRTIMNVKRPKTIKEIFINPSSHDETNGEVFLDFMNGAFDLVQIKDKEFCPPWLKIIPKDQQVIAHAIHCLLNSFTCSRPDEIRFYAMMLQHYTVGYKRNR